MAEWATSEVITVAKFNQKSVYVGAGAPGTTYAGMIWYDSANDVLYIRDGANANWVTYLPAGQTRILYNADDDEVSQTGTTETQKKYFRFIKTANIQLTDLRVCASMKTSNAAHHAHIKIYLDAEGAARLTLTSSSVAEEAQEGSFDISDLAAGIHTVRLYLYSDNAGETAYNYIWEVYGEK